MGPRASAEQSKKAKTEGYAQAHSALRRLALSEPRAYDG
jgi:hypothetical protein